MTHLRKGAAALVATAALTLGGVSTATATAAPSDEPCATQQTQLDRATAKLEVLTERFAAKKAKVKKERKDLAAAKGSEKAQAKKALAQAKRQKTRVAKAKKAQVQRVAKATQRLEKCQAAQA